MFQYSFLLNLHFLFNFFFDFISDKTTCDPGEKCVDVSQGQPGCVPDDDFDCVEAGGCLVEGQECAPDGPNGKNVCGVARTCKVLGCPNANQDCVVVVQGQVPQCVAPDDCFAIQCPFNEECRADSRGPQVCFCSSFFFAGFKFYVFFFFSLHCLLTFVNHNKLVFINYFFWCCLSLVSSEMCSQIQ